MTGPELVLTAVNRGPSLYEAVSEQLLKAIRGAGLRPGSKIPSERELGVQFGVSRTVIREAIRHLAAKGVLQVQSGSGVQVADIGHEGISESLDLYLRQRGPLDPDRIHEVRESLEVRTAELAATRATDEQLRRIGEVCESMATHADDPDGASAADVAFHRAIAEAADNALFLVLIDSLGEVLMEIRRATLGERRRRDLALVAHRKVAEALASRDATRAGDAMREHLMDSREALSKTLSSRWSHRTTITT